jgi:hypothetical protein
MTLSAHYSVCIAVPTSTNAHSRVRKQFNTLVKRTEAARWRLADWKQSMPGIMSQAEREFQPLARAYAVHRRDIVLLLDCMHRDKVKAKRERAKLSKLICSIALELLADGEDPELKAILDYHRDDDGGMSDEEEAALMDMMADIFGVEVDDVRSMRSPEGFFAALGAHPDDDEDEGAEAPAAQAGRATRRKSAAAQAREQREAAEAGKLKQTVRDIFRKLTSELHPDREPDAAERARKTALMQRVTVAYKANDLLSLLELQLEIELIGQADLNSLSDERIRQYNKILDGQLREVEAEIVTFECAALMQCGGRLRERPTPQALSRRLHIDIAEMRGKVKTAAAELEEFRDVNALKAWLKTWRQPAQSPYDDGFWF